MMLPDSPKAVVSSKWKARLAGLYVGAF